MGSSGIRNHQEKGKKGSKSDPETPKWTKMTPKSDLPTPQWAEGSPLEACKIVRNRGIVGIDPEIST